MKREYGTITICTDKPTLFNIVCNDYLKRFRFIIADQDPDIPIGNNIISGSILIPPTDALECIINYNDIMSFKQRYFDYLYYNNYVREYIHTILTALYLGVNVVIYADASNQMDIPYLEVLMTFLNNTHGIIITPNGAIIQDPSELVEAAYLTGVIDANKLFLEHPANKPLSGPILYRLYEETRPMIDRNNEAAISQYFNDWKKNAQAKNAPLVSPVSMGDNVW